MRTHLLAIPADADVAEGTDPGPAANDASPAVAPALARFDKTPAQNDSDDYWLGGYAGI